MMFTAKHLLKLARAPFRHFATHAKQDLDNKHVTMLAPAVLSTAVVVGIYNMQSVTNEIREQTNYGYRYKPKNT